MQSSADFYRQIVQPNSDQFLQDIVSLAKAFAAISSIHACLNHIVIEKILDGDPTAKVGLGPERKMREKLLSGPDYTLRALRLAVEVSDAFRHGARSNAEGITSSSGEISVRDFGGWSAYLSRAGYFGDQVIFESRNMVGNDWLGKYAMNFRFCSVERIVTDCNVALPILLNS